MKKIDSSLLVCTIDQTKALMALGIEPMACFCYELMEVMEDKPKKKGKPEFAYSFAGEYSGQEDCIPAWTYEELCVMIGGEFIKPDLKMLSDFMPQTTKEGFKHETEVGMMQYIIKYLSKMKTFPNGAMAAADLLLYALENKELIAKDCSVRLNNFYKKPFPNL